MTNNMQHQHRNHRRASFDITSLSYYSRCQQLSLLAATTNSTNDDSSNDNKKCTMAKQRRRRKSIHELPSQLEFQIMDRHHQNLNNGCLICTKKESGLITANAAAAAIITTNVDATDANAATANAANAGASEDNNENKVKPTTSSSEIAIKLKSQNNDALGDDNISQTTNGIDRTVVVESEQQSYKEEGELDVVDGGDAIVLVQHSQQHPQQHFTLQEFDNNNEEEGESHNENEEDESTASCDWKKASLLERTTTATTTISSDCSDEDTLLLVRNSCGDQQQVDVVHNDEDNDEDNNNVTDGMKRWKEVDWEESKEVTHDGIDTTTTTTITDDDDGDDGLEGIPTGPKRIELELQSSVQSYSNKEGLIQQQRQYVELQQLNYPKEVGESSNAVESNTSSSIATTTSFHSSNNNNNNNSSNNESINDKMDILTEGQYHLSISMLVYMYAHLRETCRMGHTRVKMEEIDCNNIICNYNDSSCRRRLLGLQQQQHYNSSNPLTAGSIIRIIIDELQDYDKEHTNDQYYYQPNTLLHHREYEESVMKEFRQWIEHSRVSQLDSNTQELIASMRMEAMRAPRWQRTRNGMRMTSTSRLLSSDDGGDDGDDGIIVDTSYSKNPNKQQIIHYLRRQVAKYRWKRAIAKVRLAVKLGGGKSSNVDFNIIGDKVTGNRYVNMNKLLQMGLEKTPKYFKEGSALSNLIESSLEVVSLSDFIPNDVVYGICVQREEKKITIVFRGGSTINSHNNNWSMNLRRYDMMEIPNPVDDYYPGRAEKVDVHSGFALYLLRRRRDTQRSKMDEIFEKIEQIGKELGPDGDYKICITGHSMGGALATLFGFFLGAKLRQSQHHDKNQEVQVYTFASPRVGGESFLYAYQHLERAGLIRHARFSCTNDIVPLIPLCNFELDNLKFYKHVGMRVQLHNTGPIGKWRLRKRLDVSYPLCHDWSSTVARGLLNCMFANLNTRRGYKTYHTLTEYQTRLHFALTYRKALALTAFFLDDERRHRLKSLDEYYALRGAMNIDVYSYVSLIPSPDGVNVRKILTKVFLVIPLMYAWTRLLSRVASAEIIIPQVAHWVLMEQLPKFVAAIPFPLILQNLLILSFGLTFMIEVIKIAIKIPYRWGRFKQMSGRLMLTAPLLNVWVKFIIRLTNVVMPKNAHRLILKHLINLRKLVPFFAKLVYKLLQLSFGLSFVMVALGISIRARSNRRGRSLGRVFTATLMLTAWVFLFSAACKNMATDIKTAAEVSGSNKPGWGLTIERHASLSNNIHRLIPRHMFNLRKLMTFFAKLVYKLLQLSFGLSFVMVALGISIRARSNRRKRSLGRVFTATLMLTAWAFLFSAAYKNMASDDRNEAEVSNTFKPGWGLTIDNKQMIGHLDNSSPVLNEDNMSNIYATTIESKLPTVQEQLSSIQEYATGIEFDPILDNGLYLVGAGVRKKSVIKVYAVAMYSTPKVLLSTDTHASLRDAARTFDSTSIMTSFVLEMVYSAGAEKIAGAIAESVKPRYYGTSSDIVTLESLIIKGVDAIGGQAIKGTTFRFDCSEEGVSVSVNGVEQGAAAFEGLGSAFVDVFMDGNSVSPTLKDSCIKTWSTDDNRSTAESLMELAKLVGGADSEGPTENKPDEAAIRRDFESQLKPIQEYATSIIFDPKLDEGLYLVGTGVRKKSIVKVYAVALYGSATVLNAVSSPATLRTAARTFDASTPLTSFVLEMVYSASAEKIGGAIADSVKPRYSGSVADIDALESLIVEGVNNKGGQATKGTTFRFDCSQEGVTVTIDGFVQGTANFTNFGSAFVDVFVDDNAVSPTLVSSCIDSWLNPEAKAIAASLLELDQLKNDVSTDEQVSGEEAGKGPSRKEVESQLSPIQEYATGIEFDPILDNGLYLVGAGVRKKSVIKVYAVAMYSTPKVLLSTDTHASLRDAARTFDSTSIMTSFVLEMVYSAGAEKIAGAIAESVKPRYYGTSSDIVTLESLIIKGVDAIGGQAIKGTTFRFDCSEEGVSVSVNGVEQGAAAFEGLGSAFVDVFMDGNSVSPTLKDSCVNAWSSEDAKLMATKLLKLNDKMHPQGNDNIDSSEEEEEDEVEVGPDNATATKIEERKETTTSTTTTISSIELELNDDKTNNLKTNTSSKPKHNPLKKAVKYAFPVF